MNIPSHCDNDDPWMVTPGPVGAVQPELEQPAPQVQILEGVEPLDAQVGVFPKKAVPSPLNDALFIQPEPMEGETEAAGGDPAAVPPLQTYAILDAGKVTNLPELLERSGLEHRCLFMGDAYNKLKNVAPWIVRLEEANSFTRHLFTRSDASWHLWDNEPGIYVRSRADLDKMSRHFRKFTRVQHDSKKWYYFRFWEPRYASRYFRVIANDFPEKMEAWFNTSYGQIHSIGIRCGAEFTNVISSDMRLGKRAARKHPFRYQQPERDAHLLVKRRHFIDRLNRHLASSSERFNTLDQAKQSNLSWHIVGEAAKSGITVERAVADYATASILLWRPLETLPVAQKIIASNFNQLDKGRELLRLAVSENANV